MKNIGNIVKYLAIATVVMASTLSSQSSAVAGSGYYDYGVHGGYMQLMGDDLDFTDESSGASFGFKRGMYFIKDGLTWARGKIQSCPIKLLTSIHWKKSRLTIPFPKLAKPSTHSIATNHKPKIAA